MHLDLAIITSLDYSLWIWTIWQFDQVGSAYRSFQQKCWMV